jgi:RecB family exonuclease
MSSVTTPRLPRQARIIVSPRAAERIGTAREWLGQFLPATEILLLAAVPEAADDLLRNLARDRGGFFAIHRLTLGRLAGLLAADAMAASLLAPADGLATIAIAARAIARTTAAGKLSYFAPVASRPGFPGALAATIRELRLACIDAAALAARGEREASLAELLANYEAELDDAGLADHPALLRLGAAAAASATPPRFIGLPTLLLDVPVASVAEHALVRALSARAPSLLATIPAGDSTTLAMLQDSIGVAADTVSGTTIAESALARLQDHLFADTPPSPAALDPGVTVVSAAGEMQECIEIARVVHAEARAGTPFDRIAIALHAPSRYSACLREALDRASVPAFFARGTARPEPGGRAVLTLLACAAEGLSARRFAEYLSLAQVPSPNRNAIEDSSLFVIPSSELGAVPLFADFEPVRSNPEIEPAELSPSPVVEGEARAPWRWERLLVDAAVIGKADRWRRRLAGLAEELKLRRGGLDDDDDPRATAIDRDLLDLSHLRETALPLIDALASLPVRARWDQWLAHLRDLANLAVRDRAPVLAALGELEPMGPVGPVDLDEVRLVLAARLGQLEMPPPHRRYGAVFVAPPVNLRGLEFDIVIVPGLAERIFPKKLTEDPILPDSARSALGANMATQSDRALAERMALRMAAGAATQRAIFSYPRVDLAQGRPRVPSFYALEVLRSAEGRLPGFDELSRRAAGDETLRSGWPAPTDPELAIDDAEFDLAVLERLADRDPAETAGAANYLLNANDHLARALRWRARRWLRRWTPADGLVDPGEGARAALERHRLDSRSYSPTALQNFAACPYRFFLQAIHRLRPREEAIALETIDPLTRGAMFHEIQFTLLTELRRTGLLPITQDNLDAAIAVADHTLEKVAASYHDRLAPAIERVWRDGIDSMGADLREWIRRAARDSARWVPERFELSFGLADRTQADPASQAAPVPLQGGLLLRGSIDLVESSGAMLRVTDHKTGRAWAPKGVVVNGGKILQPVLYALAAERILAGTVAAGRLYYCTSTGGYEERVVALDDVSRNAASDVVGIIGRAIDEGFLPAAPNRGECRLCDYRAVCGPYEEQRIARKPAARLGPLGRLRAIP